MNDYYYSIKYDSCGYETNRIDHPSEINNETHDNLSCHRLVHIQAETDGNAFNALEQWLYIKNPWVTHDDRHQAFDEEINLYGNEQIVIHSHIVENNLIQWQACEVEILKDSFPHRRHTYKQILRQRKFTKNGLFIFIIATALGSHYLSTLA